MAIENDIAQARALLDKIYQYERLVVGNTFQPDTIADMKGNAKDLCDEVKDKIDDIKTEIDNWS